MIMHAHAHTHTHPRVRLLYHNLIEIKSGNLGLIVIEREDIKQLNTTALYVDWTTDC
jgi:hypothetical protein